MISKAVIILFLDLLDVKYLSKIFSEEFKIILLKNSYFKYIIVFKSVKICHLLDIADNASTSLVYRSRTF